VASSPAQTPALEPAPVTGTSIQEAGSAVVDSGGSPPEFRIAGQEAPKGDGILPPVPELQTETVAAETGTPEAATILEARDEAGSAQERIAQGAEEGGQAVPLSAQDLAAQQAEAEKPEPGAAGVATSPRDPRASQTPGANAPAGSLWEGREFSGPAVIVDGPMPRHLYKLSSPRGADAPAGATSGPVRRGGLRWGIAAGAAAVLVLVGLVYWLTRPATLAPGVYSCQTGAFVTDCKVSADANGDLYLDERPYTSNLPLFGSLSVNGGNVLFKRAAGTGYCSEPSFLFPIKAKIGQIIPAFSSAIVPEEVEACKQQQETAHLKYDLGKGAWIGSLVYYNYVTKYKQLPNHRERVVGFDRRAEGMKLKISPRH
jgi:hypothetical protein